MSMLLHTNNFTAEGIINRTIVQKLSKSMDMHFYLPRNQKNEKYFQVYWEPGSQNLGDHHTKHHQATYHHSVNNVYLHLKTNKIQERGMQRGCVDPAGPWTARAAALIT